MVVVMPVEVMVIAMGRGLGGASADQNGCGEKR
jgi:hypothetical protein